MSYYEFLGTVAGGRQGVDAAENNVMPAFGQNPNAARTAAPTCCTWPPAGP